MVDVVSKVLLGLSGVIVGAYAVEGVGFLLMLRQGRPRNPEDAGFTEDDEAFM